MAPFLDAEQQRSSTAPPTMSSIDKNSINTLRALSIDASFKAGSGHPGAPLGMTPLFHVLFQQMRLNPKTDRTWINRDRFVLSNGHACSLLYSMLHLLGYPISVDDLKYFRQLGSITPGHPESHITPGVEVTTGPLGQGFASAVGLAIAQAHLAARFNKPGFPLFSNHTYVVFGDGCAMEGIASEAASLAGHLKLENLIAIYDDNQICIDGSTDATFTEDVTKRFESYGWRVLTISDGDHHITAIADALRQAKDGRGRPTMIKVRTTIGYGSTLQGTAACHGSPLTAKDIEQFRRAFNIPTEPFTVGGDVKEFWGDVVSEGIGLEAQWQELFRQYASVHPALFEELDRRMQGKMPPNWMDLLPRDEQCDQVAAGRKYSQNVLERIHSRLPELISGSADLTSSNLTRWTNVTDFQGDLLPKLGNRTGRYLRWGVREHAMGAAMNGIAAYGANLVPIGGTFLNFVSYAAGAVRIAALSGLRVIWIATHDSIALGEDGPTHQPIETLAHFRAMPNINVWRPADGNETSAAYAGALSTDTTPSLIALSRQALPRIPTSFEKAMKGGYVLIEAESAEITLISTGSEVRKCVEAAKMMSSNGTHVRVVSMPCAEAFDSQPFEYRLSVLKRGIPIMSVEALSTFGWAKYSHTQFGVDSFGASAPAEALFEAFQMTSQGIVERAQKTILFFQRRRGLIDSPIEMPFEPVQLR